MPNPIDTAFKEQIIPGVVQIVRTATSLKTQDIAFHKSLDKELERDTENVASRLVDIGNDIIDSISHEEVDLKTDKELRSSGWKVVSNALDTLFERSDVLFDEIKRGPKSSSTDKFTYLEESNNGSKDDTKRLGKKMEKPQVDFKIPVDNSELGPFKPKISEKPNAVKPIEESVKLIQPGKIDDTSLIDPPFYPHPYEYEIDNQPYPDSILSKNKPIPSQPWESDNLEWIDKPEQLEAMVAELSKSSEIAVDLEHHDYRTYYGLVCLMQISNREKDWIVDTLALRDDLAPLNKVFTDPKIVKIFHGAFMDIIWLQRDLGLYIVSLFDTYHASRKLGFPKFSLAYLLETFAHFKTSKKYQLADWRIRPLPKPMLAYARSDTHFLLNIYDQLKNKLLDKDDDKMKEVLFESRKVAKRRFEYTKFRPLTQNSNNLVTCPVMSSNPQEPYLPIVVQYNIPYHIKPVVEALYNWRDTLARNLDESVRYIMPNQALALLATLSRPVDEKKILTSSFFVTEFVRDNAKELADLINDALNRSENNDWDLVDEIHTTNHSSDRSSSIPDSLVAQAQIFNDLCHTKGDLLDFNSTSGSFSASKVFASAEPQVFSIKFGKSLKKITIEDASHRDYLRQKALDELSKHVVTSEIITPSAQAETKTEAETTQKVTSQETVTELAPQPVVPEVKESKDDIITLRPNKKQRKGSNKRKHQSDEPAVNFSEMESLMTGKPEEYKGKKRKFDPYSKTGTGPKAARKPKQFHDGRSSTFKR